MLLNILPIILLSLTSIVKPHTFYYEEEPLADGRLLPTVELMEAVRANDVGLVKIMLQRDQYVLTPSTKYKTFRVPYSIAKRENPNTPALRRYGPLHLAVLNNSVDMIKLLIDNGANPAAQGRSSPERPVEFVRSPEAFSLLGINSLSRGSHGNTIVHILSSKGYYVRDDGKVMSWLPEIQKYSELHFGEQNDFGETALHCAARDHGMHVNAEVNKCYKEIVEFLLTLGNIDPNARDNDGLRAYDLAPAPSSKNIVRQALKAVTRTKWNFITYDNINKVARPILKRKASKMDERGHDQKTSAAVVVEDSISVEDEHPAKRRRISEVHTTNMPKSTKSGFFSRFTRGSKNDGDAVVTYNLRRDGNHSVAA